ncbi:MAG TPA: hypothetical protein VFF53_07035, partial [Geobacteraceae bacterium]|nr:hypothetical protein [Geobacteraceae bacterium]
MLSSSVVTYGADIVGNVPVYCTLIVAEDSVLIRGYGRGFGKDNVPAADRCRYDIEDTLDIRGAVGVAGSAGIRLSPLAVLVHPHIGGV